MKPHAVTSERQHPRKPCVAAIEGQQQLKTATIAMWLVISAKPGVTYADWLQLGSWMYGAAAISDADVSAEFEFLHCIAGRRANMLLRDAGISAPPHREIA